MENKVTFRPELPEGCDLQKERILLHCCCAPCSTAILEWMVGAGLRPGIFFSNSNIFPFDEYVLRRDELVRYAAKYGLQVVDDEYDHNAWREAVRGLEKEPERGLRCLECFRFRLVRAARYASEHGCTVLTTTLASSRWKDLAQVGQAGEYACSLVNGNLAAGAGLSDAGSGSSIAGPGSRPLVWWNQNWRKGGLQDRRNTLIIENCLYNQTWCGCEFQRRSV